MERELQRDVSDPLVMDQAIFASVQSLRGGGYQLAATSPGITATEARELSTWGPSHDSLWEASARTGSFNHHRLQSGRFALSRSIPAAAEYSGRGGNCIYTHYLVLDRLSLEKFDNNPFAVLRAAGHTEQPLEPIPSHLPRWQTDSSAPRVDAGRRLKYLVEQLGGPLRFASALDTVLDCEAVAFVGSSEAIEAAMEALCLCLPEKVGQLSFATGLKYSPRRPARWIGLHGDAMTRRRLARQYQFQIVDLQAAEPTAKAVDALASVLERFAQVQGASHVGSPCLARPAMKEDLPAEPDSLAPIDRN